MERASTDRTDRTGSDPDIATAEGTDRHVVGTLRPFRASISGIAARQPAVPFVAATWRRWLVEAGCDDVADRVLARLPGDTIDRADLEKIATDGSPDVELLVATLMWARGTGNGRMGPHVIRALRHPDRDRVLARSGELAEIGDLEAAHAAWAVPGLNEASFTKWLWSAGRRGDAPVRPLVLDGRVRSTLEVVLDRPVVGPPGRSRRYADYVEACHRWAAKLSVKRSPVSADDLVRTMFLVEGDPDRLSDLETIGGNRRRD